MTQESPLIKIDNFRWRIEKTGSMRTEGLIFASEKMIPHICSEKAVEQVSNVATLPGIVGKSLAMPDVHWGYGFPIGGVAAFDLERGIISPGGVGYDINCGVRVLRTNLRKQDITVSDLVHRFFKNIPSGVGSTGKLTLNSSEMKNVLLKGAQWAIQKGFGSTEDINHTEENGCMEGADYEVVSARAIERGRSQLGTLGAGNHFLEIQEVVEIFDEKVAGVFGLFLGQITVMIHTGSRGLGYQICDDYLKILQSAVNRYQISLPDRQLACAPINSPEGKDYFSAMAAAANYAWANRQLITHWVREAFSQSAGKSIWQLGLEVVYDVAHNIAKFEEHIISNGDEPKGSDTPSSINQSHPKKNTRRLLVHRKGATRSFSAGHSEIPRDYKSVGQPVIVPGTMGTSSFILVGTDLAMKETWGSSCHGAGRVMSRSQILKQVRGEQLKERLTNQGIMVLSDSWKTLAEEAPEAYKDVGEVVDVCHKAGIAKKVAKLKPLGVIKG